MTTTQDGALSTIRALSHDGNTRHFNDGDVVFRSGESGDCLYGIVSGSVKVDWDEGRMQETLGPGHCVGVGALVEPEHLRYGNAIALGDAELLVMNREQFLFAVQELPVFGLEMLQKLDNRLRNLKARTHAPAVEQVSDPEF
ncbi:Crp/Fnr family transcriptional regulator [Synechococcus sp. RedBA-s]|uniref:Crp/Fnr family transcriptional regulator n=1 Tax=Synechococcus sp. RedBA-s TaxID=2823741 RepID=UPI0020CCB1A0|nr:cyclic nucleotide-binding domain-containing protein [Synechococcus sp. RedBA-s]MCP9801204.1 cyclic nucleotide-binding domain-containing protein [Synechococcus sp. RedBA-s]